VGIAGVVLLILSGSTAGTAAPSDQSLYEDSVVQVGPTLARAGLTSDTRLEIASAASFHELEAVAAGQGTVRVIVTLQALWAPEQLLDPVERVSQSNVITSLQQELIDGLGRDGYRVIYRYDYIPAIALELDEPALARLLDSGLAARVQLDEIESVSLTESVPLINGDDVRSLGYDGTGQSVAIVDTGVDRSHSFLAGRVVAEACFSFTGDCPGGGSEAYGTGAAAPCDFDTASCPHGTHVAGIAAGDDLPTRAGVAPDADIVAVQVFSNDSGSAGSWPSDQLKALEYIYSIRDTYNVAAVNLSIGSSLLYSSACDSDPRKLAIDNLLGAGVATVISAGNEYADNGVSAPGCISTAVTVASSTKSDVRSDFSNVGEMVDVIAPGSSITSSVPGGYASYNGTSMAAPHVTGAWALLREAYPNAGVNNILAAIKYSPVTIASDGWVMPRIDIANALSLLATPWPENDPFEDAAPLSSPASFTASTVRATVQSGEPTICLDPDAGFVSDITATVWYRLDPAYSTEITVDTGGSGFDTTLGLYEGTTVDQLTPVACNDDYGGTVQSQLIAGVDGGQTYWLQVGGYEDFGALSLDVTDIGDLSSPPTWPGAALAASNILKDELTLSWSAASDDDAVVGYRVYVDGFFEASTTARTYTVTDLFPNTTYDFEIEAYDAGDHRTVGPTGLFTTASDFIDTDGLIFEEAIEWLSGAGITQGCNPPLNDMFCPNDNVTRGQMAAFLVRALDYSDSGAGDFFVDDDGSVFEDSIDKLAVAKVTAGCNPPLNDRFCPGDNVTRGQMAAFLVRALGLTDSGSVDFTDDNGSVFEANIEMLAAAGITKGCNPPVNDRFCPNDYVTRGQMAAFLQRALG
jgi:subtilisin family serine protease